MKLSIKYYLFFLIIQISALLSKTNFVVSNSSYITMKVQGPGKNRLFHLERKSEYYPNEIYVNGNNQTIINFTYYLNETENHIKLVWYNNINNSNYMFYGCSHITEIDFSHFDSSQIYSMDNMFSGCSVLTSLNFSNFDTSQVSNMKSLFNGCESLKSLNLSNFNTSKVTTMTQMFAGCSSLVTLDLSSFNTSNVNQISSFFYGCSRLEYINMISFDPIKISKPSTLLEGISPKAVICPSQQLYDKIKYNLKDCQKINCSSNWKSVQKKMIDGKSDCVESCSDTDDHKYEYNGKCYENCKYGYYIDIEDSSKLKCKCETETKCLSCSSESLEDGLCIKCNNELGYYPKYNDPSNKNNYVECYIISTLGFYLDRNDLLLKPCYNSCKTCEIGGNSVYHNCLRCKNSFKYAINKNNSLNCYLQCEYYFYRDDNGKLFCTESNECPEKYNISIENENECVKEIEELISSKMITEDILEEKCNIDKPFKIIKGNICSIYCCINDIINEECVLDYNEKDNKTDYFF